MDPFSLFAGLITISALLSYFNYRTLKLPTTIGVMLSALALSLGLIGLGTLGFGLEQKASSILRDIQFDRTLMHGMLSFLLFAGSLHVNLEDLKKEKWVIASLTTFGLLISTFLIGGLMYGILSFLGIQIRFIESLLFGALISPTDPIAVLSILRTAKAPKTLETKIAGESLFNDGIAVVIFLVLVGMAFGGDDTSAHGATTFSGVALLFAQETLGGVVFGFVAGLATYYLIKTVDDYSVELMLTLALVAGGYTLATHLHLSGPIAMVVAGLFIGNHGRAFGMSARTRQHLDTFWLLVDDILNTVLFVLIGLEVLVLSFTGQIFMAGLAAIPVVLFARFISVGIPIQMLRLKRSFAPGVIKIMTWGGLRGGISVALALSLPPGDVRDALLAMTYMVVIFSVVVQGLTIGKLVKKLK